MKNRRLSIAVISHLVVFFFFAISLSAQDPLGSALLGKTANEQFGRVVRLSADGTVLAVAAPFNSDLNDKNGRIAVYKFDGKAWSIMGSELFPEHRSEFEFGEMMELSADGQNLIVATYFGGISRYSFDGTNWTRSVVLPQKEGIQEQIEAIAVSADAEKIAVAYESQVHRTICIKTLQFDGNVWIEDEDQIIPYPAEKVYRMALSLSGDGNQLGLGNYSKMIKGKKLGEILFFERENNQWIKKKSFVGEIPDAYFGSQVTLSTDGNIAIAASTSIDILNRSAGYVESYERVNNIWVQRHKALKPKKSNSYFGHSIAISASGNVLAVSMPYLGFGQPGIVDVFHSTASGWNEVNILMDVNGVETTRPPNNTVGWSISLSSDGRRLAVGFPHNDENGDMSGKVIVYTLDSF